METRDLIGEANSLADEARRARAALEEVRGRQRAHARTMLHNGVMKSRVARELDITRATLDSWIDEDKS
ncbi:hypothetical protein KV102_00345 [Mumia sp. zg.B53]|uniref:hypothetical protein n=1 Tax=Mumia sp. zg.B53 TaxID=2855449 RepID=UPI001C6E9AFB|nr:hypothetical protein [Mumia sp. zg.B53]MBW9213275.1 hypothetical protein [Mumia sp. zg.B53]